MAGVTVLGGALELAIDMAFCAGSGNMRASQLEHGQVVVKGGGLPGSGGVTGTATGSICAGMRVFGQMTGNAVRGSTLEHAHRGVAFGADSVDVRSGQDEGRVVMVEGGWLPTGGRMAAFAGSPLGAGMHILALMAAKAGGGRILELEGYSMALRTRQAGVSANQFESRAMVKGGRFPTGGAVAVFASAAFAACVLVIALVAADTGGWRTLEFAFDMALDALGGGVQTGQLESGRIVVKGGWLPGCGGMTAAAGRTQIALMGVVLEMAGDTV